MKGTTIIGPVLLIILWELTTRWGLVDTFLFPNPATTLHAAISLLGSGPLIHDVLASLQRVGIAFMLASGIGVPLGLILGTHEKIYRSIELIIDFFRSTPATAIFPLFLLIFGVDDASKIAVAAFAALLIILFNTAYGVIHAKKVKIVAAKIMGANPWQRFHSITFWESLPQTIVGLRNAVSLSLVIIIVTEMFIGTHTGLGRKIIDFQLVYDIPSMYAAILITGTLGYLLNLLFILIEKKILHWSGK